MFNHIGLFATPWTVACLLCPWDSPGKYTGVGCHALLQGIFSTQRLNLYLLHLLHLQADFLFFLTIEPPGKPQFWTAGLFLSLRHPECLPSLTFPTLCLLMDCLLARLQAPENMVPVWLLHSKYLAEISGSLLNIHLQSI